MSMISAQRSSSSSHTAGHARSSSSHVTRSHQTNYTSSGHSIKGAISEVSLNTVNMTGAQIFQVSAEREKKEMQELNDRLGNYIARVKLLEDQNRALVSKLTDLRAKWGTQNSQYKSTYSESITSVRKDIDNAARGKVAIDVKVARLRDDITEYRARHDEMLRLRDADRLRVPGWNAQIKEAEQELHIVKNRYESVVVEEKAALAETQRLWKDLASIKETLDAEVVARLDWQGQAQSIYNEINFIKRVHETEVQELNSLLVVAPADTKIYFQNELALAIRDIRKEYEILAHQSKIQIEGWYKGQVEKIKSNQKVLVVDETMISTMSKIKTNMSELHTKYSELESRNASLAKEVSSLQFQVTEDQRQYEAALVERDATLARMRDECHILIAELQALLDTKQTLDAEIAIYRAMLEGEERRVGVVKLATKEESYDNGGEMIAKTRFQTHAKGHVAIARCDQAGSFIIIENNSSVSNEDLSGYSIRRVIDGGQEHVFHFPAGFVLHAGEKLKCGSTVWINSVNETQEKMGKAAADHIFPNIYVIFAGGKSGADGDFQTIVWNGASSWGMGLHVVTTLYNRNGEERATYTQRTVIG